MASVKLKILQVVPSYLPAVRYGGPIYSVHGLSRALVKRGHDVSVYTTNVDGASISPVPVGEPVDLDGVTVWYFPCGAGRRLYRSPAMGKALAHTISQFDVVHLHSVFLWPTLAGARAARKAGMPYVLAPRGMLVGDLINRKSRLLKSTWVQIFERTNIAQAASIHVTASVEKAEIEKLGFRARRFDIIPNGVDVPESETIAREVVADRRPYVLALGRVNWKKGLDRLIRAMVLVREADLVIAGNDEENYQRELEQIAGELGMGDRVRFLGPVRGDEKWKLIREATLFALPSYSENFGIAVLEAMACATPVIVTPEVGLAEAVASSEAGLVVDGEPENFGAAIKELLADPERREIMGAAGRLAALETFSWDAIGRQMEQVYRSVIAERDR